SDCNGLARSLQSFPVAAHFVVPEREGQTESCRFGVNAMRAANLRRVLKLKRAHLERLQQSVDFFKQQIAGFAQQQGVGGVDDIRRRQSVMNEARGVADVFSQVGSEGDDVVVRGLLDFTNALRRKLRARFDLIEGFAGNGAQ